MLSMTIGWAELDALNATHYQREPWVIVQAVQALDDAVAAHDEAVNLHIEAGTDATRDAMIEAQVKVIQAQDQLIQLRREFHAHPLDFWQAEDARDLADTQASARY